MLEDGLLRPHRIRRYARVTVRLTPNGGRDAIAGFQTAADGEENLKVRVRAVPEKG